jgi:hypothetical protein
MAKKKAIKKRRCNLTHYPQRRSLIFRVDFAITCRVSLLQHGLPTLQNSKS